MKSSIKASDGWDEKNNSVKWEKTDRGKNNTRNSYKNTKTIDSAWCDCPGLALSKAIPTFQKWLKLKFMSALSQFLLFQHALQQ